MLADAHYFNSRISRLEGAGDLGPHIVEVVKNKTVHGDPQSEPNLSEKKDVDPGQDSERIADANGEPEKT